MKKHAFWYCPSILFKTYRYIVSFWLVSLSSHIQAVLTALPNSFKRLQPQHKYFLLHYCHIKGIWTGIHHTISLHWKSPSCQSWMWAFSSDWMPRKTAKDWPWRGAFPTTGSRSGGGKFRSSLHIFGAKSQLLWNCSFEAKVFHIIIFLNHEVIHFWAFKTILMTNLSWDIFRIPLHYWLMISFKLICGLHLTLEKRGSNKSLDQLIIFQICSVSRWKKYENIFTPNNQFKSCLWNERQGEFIDTFVKRYQTL